MGLLGKKRFLGLRGFKLNVAIGVIAGLDFLLFGYDQGVVGALLGLHAWLVTFPEIDTSSDAYKRLPADQQYHNTIIQGISVGGYTLGCLFGALPTIWIGNKLGRRKTIFLGSSIMIVGAILQATSFGLPQLIVARFITGMGNGINTSTVPTWQSECSKAHRRGQLVMIEGAMITGGICLSYWIDFGFSFLDPSSVAWRFPIAFQVLLAAIILVFVLELPESPRWLILKGKEEEAFFVLAALNEKSVDDPFIKNEIQAIKDTVIEASKGSFWDLFTTTEDRHLHRVILAYVNQVFQQISGINLITYYLAIVLETQVGLSPFLSRVLAAANGTEYFLASWISVFTIEKFGRRSLMLFGAAGQSISMIVLAITGKIANYSAGIVSVLFLFLFNTFFAIGWLGMTWLYPAEIVPLRIRAPANAVSTSANWAFNFLVVMITPVSFGSIGYKTYIVFAVLNAFIVPVVYFFYPETAYRSLEEMDTIFHKTRHWWQVVSVARHEPRRYGKNGELLIDYTQTDEFQRRASVASGGRLPSLSEGAGVGAPDAEKGNVSEKEDSSR